MTKSELIKLLETVEGDPLIVMSKDAEGNAYSPFCGQISELLYDAETTWYGDVYNPADKEEDETYVIPETAVPCIVLWPVN